MPESDSKEAVIEKTNKAISPVKVPKVPKPILKAPHFELGQDDVKSDDTNTGREEDDSMDPSAKPAESTPTTS